MSSAQPPSYEGRISADRFIGLSEEDVLALVDTLEVRPPLRWIFDEPDDPAVLDLS